MQIKLKSLFHEIPGSLISPLGRDERGTQSTTYSNLLRQGL